MFQQAYSQFAHQYDKLNSHELSLESKTTHVFKSLCLTSFLQFQFCSCLNVATNCLPMCKTTSKIKFTSIKFEKWKHSCSQKYRSYLFLSIQFYSCLSGATTYLPIYITTSKIKFTLIKFGKQNHWCCNLNLGFMIKLAMFKHKKGVISYESILRLKHCYTYENKIKLEAM
jgi:hypothetical protein